MQLLWNGPLVTLFNIRYVLRLLTYEERTAKYKIPRSSIHRSTNVLPDTWSITWLDEIIDIIDIVLPRLLPILRIVFFSIKCRRNGGFWSKGIARDWVFDWWDMLLGKFHLDKTRKRTTSPFESTDDNPAWNTRVPTKFSWHRTSMIYPTTEHMLLWHICIILGRYYYVLVHSYLHVCCL